MFSPWIGCASSSLYASKSLTVVGKVIVHQSVKVIDDLGVFFGAFEDGAYGVLYLVYCAGYVLARNGVVAHANLRDECLTAREQGLRFGG